MCPFVSFVVDESRTVPIRDPAGATVLARVMLAALLEDGMKKTLFPVALLFLSALAAHAQTKNPVSSALREILPGRQKNIVAAVEEMPAGKFNYKPTEDQMTFGHLVTHIIESNNVLCSKAGRRPRSQGR